LRSLNVCRSLESADLLFAGTRQDHSLPEKALFQRLTLTDELTGVGVGTGADDRIIIDNLAGCEVVESTAVAGDFQNAVIRDCRGVVACSHALDTQFSARIDDNLAVVLNRAVARCEHTLIGNMKSAVVFKNGLGKLK